MYINIGIATLLFKLPQMEKPYHHEFCPFGTTKDEVADPRKEQAQQV